MAPAARIGRLLRGVTAAAVLAALIAALPWALWHCIGWPLPTHLPTRAWLDGVLLAPMTPTMVLDLMACLCWAAWAVFVADVLRCCLTVARGTPLPRPSTLRPAHALAAILVSAAIVALLGPRHTAPGHHTPAPTTITTSDTAMMSLGPDRAGIRLVDSGPPTTPTQVIVLSPHDGIHDSLWRIAQRTLGDGARWPEIYALNHGKPQPDGGTFTNPSLIFPGQQLTIPTVTAPAPPEYAAPDTPHDVHHPPPTPTEPTAHPADEGSHAERGFRWGTDLYVALTLAAAVSAALTLARRHHRRCYRPGSGVREDMPVAPVVYQLHQAHLQAHHDDRDRQLNSVGDQPVAPLHRDDPPVDEDFDTAPRSSEATVVGIDEGNDVALDLAATRGLGLVGAGAAAALRALVVTALTDVAHTDTVVVTTADDLAMLVAEDLPPTLPAALHVRDSLDAALDELEAETLQRARASHDQPWPGLLLVAATPDHGRGRLQAILDNGSSLGIAAVLLGQWRPGATAYIRDNGTVSATSPGLADTLRGTLFHLGTRHTGDLLDLLHRAQPDSTLQGGAEADTPLGTDTEPAAATPGGTHENPDLEILGPEPLTVTPIPDNIPLTAPPTRQEPVPPGPSDSVPVTIRVLGALQILWHSGGGGGSTDPGHDITVAFQPRTRELLVLLAVHPGGITRDSIIDALWGHTPPARPTNALHTALSRLRHAVSVATDTAVSDIATYDRNLYRLDPALVDVDYRHFEHAVTARRSAADEHARIDAYRAIIDAYTGPLADGMNCEWIEPAREAARRDALDAVAALARALVTHDPRQTLDLLETARTTDPYNELLYRDIIRLQHRLGLHDAIPRTLSLLTTRLAEIGETLTPQTRQLAAHAHTPQQRTGHLP